MTEKEGTLREALVAECGCILYKGTTYVLMCHVHQEMWNAVQNMLHLFNQDLFVKVEKSTHERDMFG